MFVSHYFFISKGRSLDFIFLPRRIICLKELFVLYQIYDSQGQNRPKNRKRNKNKQKNLQIIQFFIKYCNS